MTIKNSKLKIKNFWMFFTFILHFTFYIFNCLHSELKLSDIPILEVKQNSQISINLLPYIYNTAKDKKLDIEFSKIKEVDCIYRADALLLKHKENFFGLTYNSSQLVTDFLELSNIKSP